MPRHLSVSVALRVAVLAPFLGACGPALVKFDTAAVDTGPGPDDTAVDIPRLSLSATDLDLGYAGANETLSAVVIASNTNDGVSPLEISAEVGDGNTHFSVDVLQASIDPGEATTLTVAHYDRIKHIEAPSQLPWCPFFRDAPNAISNWATFLGSRITHHVSGIAPSAFVLCWVAFGVT